MSWWNDLSELQRIFATVAIPTTLVMIIQFILFLFGFSHGESGGDGTGGFSEPHVELNLHDGASHEIFGTGSDGIAEAHSHDGGHSGDGNDKVDALRLFSLRGIIAFFSIGGWMGVAAIGWKIPVSGVFALAIGAGLLAMYFVAWSIRLALRLQQSGNIVLENAVGKIGEVYIPVPAYIGGVGKVNVIVQDRLCEFEAVTKAERQIKTGESVTVMGITREGVLLVAPRNNLPEGIIIDKEF